MPFGLDKLKTTVKADRAARLPPFMLVEFEKHGHTYTQNAGGSYVIPTREAENIKAILSTQSKSKEAPAKERGIAQTSFRFCYRSRSPRDLFSTGGRLNIHARRRILATLPLPSSVRTNLEHLLSFLTIWQTTV